MIGKRIKYFRKRKNLTQKELGELIGISNRNADVRIAQYESESRIPKRETISKLAKVLGVSAYVRWRYYYRSSDGDPSAQHIILIR